jgi:hypothetical protein
MNQNIIDELETLINWDYVELEEKDVIRYDYKYYSLWLYISNNIAEGNAPKEVIDFLVKNDVEVIIVN